MFDNNIILYFMIALLVLIPLIALFKKDTKQDKRIKDIQQAFLDKEMDKILKEGNLQDKK